MKKYTITVEPPQDNNAPYWSAYCKEWDFTTENETPQEALSSLFDALRIAESETKSTPVKKSVTFSIPSFS